MQNDNTIPSWVAARYTHNLGMATVQHCLQAGLSITQLFQASRSCLLAAGLSPILVKHIQAVDWLRVEADIAWCKQNDVMILTPDDPRYPPHLRSIADAPLVLFAKGNLDALALPSIGIVGARRATHMGRQHAHTFAAACVTRGLSVISGLAAGIDAAAHRGALSCEAGVTIAVMGTGMQHIYPRQHELLAEQLLARSGLLLTEFAPAAPPLRLHFPRRNRIISGLSSGVLVVEAARRSGSLITADFALEQGRDVYAIPGSIENPLAAGCHDLIAQGATLVQSPDALIQYLRDNQTLPKVPSSSTSPVAANAVIEEEVGENLAPFLACIDYAPTPMAEILARCRLPAAAVQSQLLQLELAGKIVKDSAGYCRI